MSDSAALGTSSKCSTGVSGARRRAPPCASTNKPLHSATSAEASGSAQRVPWPPKICALATANRNRATAPSRNRRRKVGAARSSTVSKMASGRANSKLRSSFNSENKLRNGRVRSLKNRT